jgi:hypothetical protein
MNNTNFEVQKGNGMREGKWDGKKGEKQEGKWDGEWGNYEGKLKRILGRKVGIGRAKKWLLDYSRTNESTKLILKTKNYHHPLKSEYQIMIRLETRWLLQWV